MSGIHVNHPSGPVPGPDEPRWTTDELVRDFNVQGFSSPYVVVIRRSDGVKGVLEFAQSPEGPRVYFNFVEAS